VGQLHGGPSACGASQLWDFYGKFAMSWDHGTTPATRLRDWLDPTNIAGDTLNGYDPNLIPLVQTNNATDVLASSATLNGTINPTVGLLCIISTGELLLALGIQPFPVCWIGIHT